MICIALELELRRCKTQLKAPWLLAPADKSSLSTRHENYNNTTLNLSAINQTGRIPRIWVRSCLLFCYCPTISLRSVQAGLEAFLLSACAADARFCSHYILRVLHGSFNINSQSACLLAAKCTTYKVLSACSLIFGFCAAFGLPLICFLVLLSICY